MTPEQASLYLSHGLGLKWLYAANGGKPDPAALGVMVLDWLLGKDLSGMETVWGAMVQHPGGRTQLFIHGTETRDQWLDDALCILVRNNYGPGLVHRGFQSIAETLHWESGVELDFYTAGPRLHVEVSGHSLGAPLALNFAARTGAPVCVAIACPLPGDINHAHWCDAEISEIHLPANPRDLVPQVPRPIPFILPYVHVAPQIRVDVDGIKPGLPPLEEVEAQHTITSYNHAFDPAQPIDPRFADAAPQP